MSEIDVRGKEINITIGDLDLTLTALSDESYSRLDAFVRHRLISVAEQSTVDMEAASRDLILSLAVREASVATFFSDLGAKHARTPEGLSTLMCEMAREKHPKLKISELYDLFTDPVVVRKFNDDFAVVQAELFGIKDTVSKGEDLKKSLNTKQLNKEN